MHNDQNATIDILKKKVNDFVRERDWEQFHSPKNLSMAIAIEAAELMEEFRFISSEESIKLTKENNTKITNEIADIVIATLSFCNLYEIDLTDAIIKKLQQNAEKYPIDKSKGSNKKYLFHQEK